MECMVQDLSVARGGVPLLQGVGFSLVPGEALVLRAPNGAGKTTLLRCLAGLQPPLSGQVNLPEEGVAYASHADGIKTQLSVRENLRFWASVHGVADIGEALERFDLVGLQTRLAGHLSAGQKRRLGLARLLVTGRPLWLLDEPTVSLDTSAVALFGDVVRSHLAGGGMAIIATHIDLGLPEARVLELGAFKARADTMDTFDEAFL
ncbi:heme ABC exporter ATP-binding protein CcmA [Pseudooceanicola sp. CBS1P-1]|uniref:Heme ABC exporter ATP-binding protein CcmA n=1 Tax=Pseudooceanicola albus TaxID=2692189 RepID=A0A6L7FZZ5_9RHOB|nr:MULTISPECIES: heme ABC exporter ATP-binding protein CcmA [Pseudooceanicola]MBT9382275.1 heme ABC exporter ATP-binding protein CcmA [Pseudooceanicola endophyticus]MXN16818.1 heme ABC exporter ATP-binding protein CcmA [Pseudooceanicola albus]